MQTCNYMWKWGHLDLGFGPCTVKHKSQFYCYGLEVTLSPVNSLVVTSCTAKASLSLIVWHARASTASPS